MQQDLLKIVIWGTGTDYQKRANLFSYYSMITPMEIVAYVSKSEGYKKINDIPVVSTCELKDIDFNYLILDEAQSLKNFNTATAKAASEIKAEHKTALSGTVIENNLSEIYSLFKIINPSLFKSFAAFNREYIKPIYNQDSDALKELKMKIKPFILRRVKEDVLKDLPEKSE